jgi:hypothetical protein
MRTYPQRALSNETVMTSLAFIVACVFFVEPQDRAVRPDAVMDVQGAVLNVVSEVVLITEPGGEVTQQPRPSRDVAYGAYGQVVEYGPVGD